MKTQPLGEILKQITPLPYLVKFAPPQFKHKMNLETKMGDRIALVDEGSFLDIGPHSASQGGNRAEASAAYLAHAANLLPELVEALRACSELFKRQTDGGSFDASCIHPDEINATCDFVEAALAKATAVPIP